MKNNNQINVPQAREAMDKFKMAAAQEMGVNLKQGYNGDLTSREAGSVGGQMVKKMCTIRNASYTRKNRTAVGHEIKVRYIATISIQEGMYTACLELKFTDGSMNVIDTIAMENEVADNMYQRSELDWLIFKKPLEIYTAGTWQ